MAIPRLALKSLWNRRVTLALTVFSIALSVTLLLGVERLRHDARAAFANTLSGTDLVVGARAGSVQLLLYSVFRIGNPTNNLSWESYREIAAHPKVAWSVPLSLGDSHRGFRVLGTTAEYFERYRYGNKRPLAFSEGRPFDDLFDVVLGAEVAEKLGYRLGRPLVIAHGAGEVSFVEHSDKPFSVVGILERTGTPVDRTLHVSLAGIEAIHVGWRSGAPGPGSALPAERVRNMDLTPETITAALLGLKSKIATFQVQRAVNQYDKEALSAILPGVALRELWDLMGVAERALRVVSSLVVLVGLSGMATVILAGLNERRRELAILRSVGARPRHLFLLLMSESGLLALLGAVVGVALLYLGLVVAQPIIEAHYGLHLALGGLSQREWWLLGAVVGAGVLVGALPGYRAYRYSLVDGMTIRI